MNLAERRLIQRALGPAVIAAMDRVDLRPVPGAWRASARAMSACWATSVSTVCRRVATRVQPRIHSVTTVLADGFRAATVRESSPEPHFPRNH
jgi:hypothetical protein